MEKAACRSHRSWESPASQRQWVPPPLAVSRPPQVQLLLPSSPHPASARVRAATTVSRWLGPVPVSPVRLLRWLRLSSNRPPLAFARVPMATAAFHSLAPLAVSPPALLPRSLASLNPPLLACEPIPMATEPFRWPAPLAVSRRALPPRLPVSSPPRLPVAARVRAATEVCQMRPVSQELLQPSRGRLSSQPRRRASRVPAWLSLRGHRQLADRTVLCRTSRCPRDRRTARAPGR